MGQVLIRKLDDRLLTDFRRAAANNGRSLEAELKAALAQARPPVSVLVGGDLLRLVKANWDATPASAATVDSTPFIRAMRDEAWSFSTPASL